MIVESPCQTVMPVASARHRINLTVNVFVADRTVFLRFQILINTEALQLSRNAH